jgi:hypothetical protein
VGTWNQGSLSHLRMTGRNGARIAIVCSGPLSQSVKKWTWVETASCQTQLIAKDNKAIIRHPLLLMAKLALGVLKLVDWLQVCMSLKLKWELILHPNPKWNFAARSACGAFRWGYPTITEWPHFVALL